MFLSHRAAGAISITPICRRAARCHVEVGNTRRGDGVAHRRAVRDARAWAGRDAAVGRRVHEACDLEGPRPRRRRRLRPRQGPSDCQDDQRVVGGRSLWHVDHARGGVERGSRVVLRGAGLRLLHVGRKHLPSPAESRHRRPVPDVHAPAPLARVRRRRRRTQPSRGAHGLSGAESSSPHATGHSTCSSTSSSSSPSTPAPSPTSPSHPPRVNTSACARRARSRAKGSRACCRSSLHSSRKSRRHAASAAGLAAMESTRGRPSSAPTSAHVLRR